MDILWAPWREQYVTRAARSKGPRVCTFCDVLKQNKDDKTFIFLRSELSFAVLNIFPFNGGHVLVLPKRHVDDLDKLTSQEKTDLMDTVVRVKGLLTKAFKPDAFNVGMNLGSMAGAGIPEHLHIHIVPRWRGDINFLPVIAGTKVIPVSLGKVYQQLKDAQLGRHTSKVKRQTRKKKK